MPDRPDPDAVPLSAREAQFCEEYLIDLNAAAAARRTGYSVRRAKQVGHELLRRPQVRARIAVRMRARAERTQITADRVLEALAAQGFAIDDAAAVASVAGAGVVRGRRQRRAAQLVKLAEVGRHVGLFPAR